MLTAELHKLKRLRIAWILMSIMIAMELLMIIGLGYAARNSPEAQNMPAEERQGAIMLTTFPSSIPPTLSFIASFGPLLALILASRLVGDEYALGTARQLVSMGLDRRRYIIIKIEGVIVASLFLLTGSLLAGSIISIIFTLISGRPLALNMLTAAFLGKAIFSIGIAWFTLGFYSIFALFLATLTRSAASAIATGLLVFFLEGNLIGLLASKFSIVGRIAPYTIGQNINQIIALIEQGKGVYGGLTHEAARAFLTLTAWLMAFAVGSMEIFRRQQLS
ncbi:MAG TPA: ABC transporter permease subunit [Firmicutes bacterium]|nr:ABC transporter permease subunit [Bacillota bacterium]